MTVNRHRKKQTAVTAYFSSKQLPLFAFLQGMRHRMSLTSEHDALNQCWPSVADDEPTLNQHWFDILCLPGLFLPRDSSLRTRKFPVLVLFRAIGYPYINGRFWIVWFTIARGFRWCLGQFSINLHEFDMNLHEFRQQRWWNREFWVSLLNVRLSWYAI